MKRGENIVKSLQYKSAKFGTPSSSRSEIIKNKYFGSFNYGPPCRNEIKSYETNLKKTNLKNLNSLMNKEKRLKKFLIAIYTRWPIIKGTKVFL